MPLNIRLIVLHRSGARIFRLQSIQGELELVKRWSFPEGHLRNQDIDADRSGRMKNRFGARISTMDRQNDAVTTLMQSTARKISDMIKRHHQAYPNSHLVVVAEPGFLGLVERALGKNLHQSIATFIAKDLAKTPDDRVWLRLRQELEEWVAKLPPHSDPSRAPMTARSIVKH